MIQIIALAGPKSSGKSTLAQQLVHSRRYHHRPFATPIKGMLDELLDFAGVPKDVRHEMLHGSLKEVPTAFLGGKTPRHAMQTLGSEWRDMLNKNLWVNIWAEHVRNLDCFVVVDDLRFKHEAERVRTLGGKVFLIHRPSLNDFDDHSSENEWKEISYDGVINNDGKPEEMLVQLEKFL